MIDLLHRIIVARKSSDRHLLASLIEQFGNATESHFREEETMMSESTSSTTRRIAKSIAHCWTNSRIWSTTGGAIAFRLNCSPIHLSLDAQPHRRLDIPLGVAISRQTA